MAADLLVRNVRPLGGDLTDIVILAGRIARGPAATDVPVLDGGGRIALPGLRYLGVHGADTGGASFGGSDSGPEIRRRIAEARQELQGMKKKPWPRRRTPC